VPRPRRFLPPWSVEETAPCFIVRDANGQALAYVYCEDEPGRRATGKLLTRDEAWRIAANSQAAGVVNRTGRIAYAFSNHSGVAEVASQAVIFYAVLWRITRSPGSASGSLGRVPISPSLIGAA
jgi:hypothetical protein